jgi:hypothetical protein
VSDSFTPATGLATVPPEADAGSSQVDLPDVSANGSATLFILRTKFRYIRGLHIEGLPILLLGGEEMGLMPGVLVGPAETESRKGEKEKRGSLSLTPFYLIWRRRPDLNRGMKDLQSFALPLGHAAIIRRRR